MPDMKNKTLEKQLWAPLETLNAMLKNWAQRHPSLVELSVIGTSRQGRPLYAAILSDKRCDDRVKEHVVVTAMHAGLERNCSSTVFAVMEWLLDQNPLARRILRNQKIICVPMPNPDGYVDGERGKALHSGWTIDGPTDPAGNPEGVAMQQIFDTFQPELLVDNHGITLDSDGVFMFEKAGCSPSNASLRPYHHEIIQMMNDAATAHGYPQDTLSSDSERLHWGPGIDDIREKLWRGRPSMRASMYCYAHYHTITCINEISWEESALIKHKCLLDIPNRIWPGYYDYGYPTQVIAGKEHHVMAYGQDAAARRQSRVELWNKQGGFTIGRANPLVDGKLLFVVATTPATAEKWCKNLKLQEFVDGLTEHKGIHSAPIIELVRDWPVLEIGRIPAISCQDKPDERYQDNEPVRNGMSLRLRIPSAQAKIREILLNGKPIEISETEGYRTWTAKAFTYIQVNIPPRITREETLFIVTCRYDSGIARNHWNAWRTFTNPSNTQSE